MKIANATTSDFYCTKCGNKGIPIMRLAGRDREAGHLKKMYCIYCQEETNHAEIRHFGDYRYEDFKKEFELGRFIDGQRLPINKLKGCKNHNCKCNIKGKCWNANGKNECFGRK